ncbi:tropomyosin-2-like [Trichogramma pretiosum]|uniref:tropomyosin-2-like n=1 Tax=Trichogramma pretiosum TaxID=7493 RepID=UPI0006C94E0B|nr:tropomyosin-2-like [Trichogramma pretiosum]
MEAIKKKIASLKQEMDLANEKVEANEVKAKQENTRADMIYDEVRDLEKKLVQMEKDFVTAKETLDAQTAELERVEKAYTKAEQNRSSMTKRVSDIETQLFKKEELRLSAQIKLARATELNDDARRMCKVLEERNRLDEERMEKLTNELKDARLIAEDADQKSDDISTKLSLVEEAAEAAEERVKTSEAKIIEREDELFIVQNIVKSLVVSEEKANARVADMKEQLKELKKRLKEAEKRAILAERTVKKLLKDVDFKEDELREEKDKYKSLCHELDATFAELTGF